MFPFLAVLICTIGSLVVLLVVITRQARLQAARAAAETVDQTQRDVQAQMEMAEWRIEQLRESRRKTAEQVSDLRNTVGHLEDHARKLETELQQLKHTWEALEQTAGVSQQDKLETELAQTLTDIQTAEEALVIAEQRAAERPPSFAVIPHQGPNQTRRRPMYIECQEDQIVLQPEAIALQPDDFDGPDGPGGKPFMSKPDAFGNRYPFGIAWAVGGDAPGSAVAKAHGYKSDLLKSSVDNTDLYKVLYEALFDKAP